MNEFLPQSLFLLTGIMAYAMAHHFATALTWPYDRRQMVFAVMCMIMVPFVVSFALTLQATNIIEFVRALKWNIALVLLFLSLFPWFIALYAEKQPRPFLMGLSALFAVLFFVNITQPYSLQFDHIDGLHTRHLPWGEAITEGVGHNGPWLYIGSTGLMVTFGYSLYALGGLYYRYRRRSDLWMMLAVCLFFLGGVEAILVRFSVIDFIELGPYSIIGMVLVMGAALTYETRQRLITSERNYRLLFEYSPTAMVAIDPVSGRIVQANKIALKLTGYSADEILSKTVTEQTHQDYLSETKQQYEQLTEGLIEHALYEKRYLKKDGSAFTGYTSISGMKDVNGKVTRLIGSIIDITERKQAEQATQEAKERIEIIFNTSPDLVLISRLSDGYITDVNNAFTKISGYTKEEVIGNLTIGLNLWANQDDRQKFIHELQTKGFCNNLEAQFQKKDGSQHTGILSAGITRIQGVSHIVSTITDITERKAIEAKVQRMVKIYAALNQCNLAIVRCTSEEELLPLVCRYAVQFGGIQMAWIGLVDETTHRVKPVACYGTGTEYLDNIQITVSAEEPTGRGPFGISFRDKQPVWIQDFKNDQRLSPWHELGVRYGWAGVASLPLQRNGVVVGALMLYATVIDAFDEPSRNLIEGMTTDISYALTKFAFLEERRKADDAMRIAAVTFNTQSDPDYRR